MKTGKNEKTGWCGDNRHANGALIIVEM